MKPLGHEQPSLVFLPAFAGGRLAMRFGGGVPSSTARLRLLDRVESCDLGAMRDSMASTPARPARIMNALYRYDAA